MTACPGCSPRQKSSQGAGVRRGRRGPGGGEQQEEAGRKLTSARPWGPREPGREKRGPRRASRRPGVPEAVLVAARARCWLGSRPGQEEKEPALKAGDDLVSVSGLRDPPASNGVPLSLSMSQVQLSPLTWPLPPQERASVPSDALRGSSSLPFCPSEPSLKQAAVSCGPASLPDSAPASDPSFPHQAGEALSSWERPRQSPQQWTWPSEQNALPRLSPQVPARLLTPLDAGQVPTSPQPGLPPSCVLRGVFLMRPAKGPAALSQHRPCVHLSRTLVSPQRRGGRWLSTWRAGAPPPASPAPWHLSHHPGSILSAMRPQKTRLLLRSREPWCAPLQSPGKRGRGRGQPRGRRLPDAERSRPCPRSLPA